MSDSRIRLERCFAAVFPDLESGQILAATPASIPKWDSVHHIMLLQTVEEEFGVEITADEYGDLVSFEAIHAKVCSKSP